MPPYRPPFLRCSSTASCRILLTLGKIKRERDSGPFRGRKEPGAVAIRCASHRSELGGERPRRFPSARSGMSAGPSDQTQDRHRLAQLYEIQGPPFSCRTGILGLWTRPQSPLEAPTTRPPGASFSSGSAMRRCALGTWSECVGRGGSLARPVGWWVSRIEPVGAIDVPRVSPSGLGDRRDDLQRRRAHR